MADRLTRRTLPGALDELARRDPDLARAYRAVGVPPIRHRRPGFATLLRIICGQQVSTASARAIFARLEAAASPLTPSAFLALDDDALRAIGFSRQKMLYGRALAGDVAAGRLDLAGLGRLDDEAAVAKLVQVKGVGRWSAEIYLLFALRRPDVWPVDDLAVVNAVARVKGLAARPGRNEMARLGEPWRPWRSAAARLMWHYYSAAPLESG